jgi:hypothetical protein
MFHGFDPLTCSDSELTSETMNSSRHFGRTPVAKPLSTQGSTTEKNASIHASSGVRTHDPSVRAVQDHIRFSRTRSKVLLNLYNKIYIELVRTEISFFNYGG